MAFLFVLSPDGCSIQDMFAMYRMRDLRKCTIRDSWVPLERAIEESIPWATQWRGTACFVVNHCQ